MQRPLPYSSTAALRARSAPLMLPSWSGELELLGAAATREDRLAGLPEGAVGCPPLHTHALAHALPSL